MKRRRVDGDEQDAYSKYWRPMLARFQRAGEVKKIKRRTHKRERREGKAEARSPE